MSYDSRLYIVEESSFTIPCDNGKRYAHIVGMIELCSCPNMLDIFTEDSNGYIYSDDGNTKIETDCYGNPLMVADIDDVINALKDVIKNEDYRRAKIAVDFLNSIKKNMPECKVYHYGH